MHPSSRILVALDVETRARALDLARQVVGAVAGFKVGLELVNSAGFGVFDDLQTLAGPDVRIFYDSKFHDIPNTVAGAARAVTRRGLWMFNIHASGGRRMLEAAVAAAAEEADRVGVAKPLVIAVTVLTSISQTMLAGELGVGAALTDHVVSLGRLAQDCGCDGVVTSPHEIGPLRAACGPGFHLLVPGVRPAGADPGDQQRVLTPAQAIAAGADFLVVGRPITGAPDPLDAARRINAETGSSS